MNKRTRSGTVMSPLSKSIAKRTKYDGSVLAGPCTSIPTDSATSGGLCRRCASLDILTHVEHFDAALIPADVVTLVSTSCNITCALRTLLKPSPAADVYNGMLSTSFYQPRGLLARIRKEGQWDSQVSYFSLTVTFETADTDKTRIIRLLPTQEVLATQNSVHSIDDNHTKLQHKHSPPPKDHVTGRKIDIHSANLDIAKEWLTDCDLHHKWCTNSCEGYSMRRPSAATLRIIDCGTRCIRLVAPGEPYICLSYVWGSQMVRDTSFSTRLPDHIPKSIEDAMYVAKRLGIPQLWVDQYCIDQHNPTARSATVQSMGLIYGGAVLTIIAAGGIDASSGLPGIRGTSRAAQSFIKVGGREFLILDDIRARVNASQWDSRGWTYQEGLLSPRRLVFTDTQMYFQCNRCHRLEELSHGFDSFENFCGDLGDDLRVFPRLGIGSISASTYDRLEEYFPRNLSYASDSLEAFEGVLDAYNTEKISTSPRPSEMKHFYGIPLVYEEHSVRGRAFTTDSLLRGLTWGLAKPTSREFGQKQSESASQFPSWTWASYKASFPGVKNSLVVKHCLSNALVLWKDIRVEVTHKQDGVIDFNLYDPFSDDSVLISHQTWHPTRPENDTRTAMNLTHEVLSLPSDTGLASLPSARHYSEFQPYIDITTLVMRFWLLPSRLAMSPYRGWHYEYVKLDDRDPHDKKVVSALYLGTTVRGPDPALEPLEGFERLVFLLVAQNERQEHKRVGLWYLDCLAGDVHYDRYWGLECDFSDRIIKFMINKAKEPHVEFLWATTTRVF